VFPNHRCSFDIFNLKLIIFTGGSNTRFKPCNQTLPDDGFYVEKICIPGNATTLGSDVVFASCDKIPKGNYAPKQVNCIRGNWSTAGRGFESFPCFRGNSTHYVAGKCTPTTQSVPARCTECGEEYFYESACGEETDATCTRCSDPVVDHYVAEVCVRGT
jgi:hypothetical protein